MTLFNEAESVAEAVDETVEEEGVAPSKRRGKRKPLPTNLPRIEVIHKLPDHEQTCACGCRKHSIGEEISEPLEIMPVQIRVIRYGRKVYTCRSCETALATRRQTGAANRNAHEAIREPVRARVSAHGAGKQVRPMV